jgi:hypothetical protein
MQQGGGFSRQMPLHGLPVLAHATWEHVNRLKNDYLSPMRNKAKWLRAVYGKNKKCVVDEIASMDAGASSFCAPCKM